MGVAFRPFFGAGEKRYLGRAITLAEDLTGRFYCIPGREWPRYPYELKTLADGPGPAAPAFADVVRLVPDPLAFRPASVHQLFRIRLRDDAILEAAEQRSDGIELFPLLLYVVTHELVHVVRFGAGFANFRVAEHRRRKEEERVHAITRGVLRPVVDAPLRRVFEAYGDETAALALPDCASPK
ncbi:MAG: hypothetical protein LAO51_11325 [Acidobacteriia bacterium]|nr:hypothetical protein [Terriglobia bacterium]